MPNGPIRKDVLQARGAEEIETTVIEHTVTTITDAYVSPDGDRVVLRRLRPGSEQALSVNEISMSRAAAQRLKELLQKFLQGGSEETVGAMPAAMPSVVRPIAAPREPALPVPDVIARFLRQEEEEAALMRAAQAKENKQAETDTNPRETHGAETRPEKTGKKAAEQPYESRGKTFS